MKVIHSTRTQHPSALITDVQVASRTFDPTYRAKSANVIEQSKALAVREFPMFGWGQFTAHGTAMTVKPRDGDPEFVLHPRWQSSSLEPATLGPTT